MFRIIALSTLITVLSVPAIVCAQAAAAPQAQPAPTQPAVPAVIGPAKLAWLNLEQAILTCEDGKREFGALYRIFGIPLSTHLYHTYSGALSITQQKFW